VRLRKFGTEGFRPINYAPDAFGFAKFGTVGSRDDHEPGQSDRVTEVPGAMIAVFFAVFGAAGSLADTAVMAAMMYFSALHGPSVFALINLSSRLFVVPALLAQFRYDFIYDREHGTVSMHTFRQVMFCGIAIGALVVLALFSKVLTLLLLACACTGTAGAASVSSYNQLAAFFEDDATAGLLAGMKLGSVAVVSVSFFVGMGYKPTNAQARIYFFTMAGLVAVGLASFLIFVNTTGSQVVKDKDERERLGQGDETTRRQKEDAESSFGLFMGTVSTTIGKISKVAGTLAIVATTENVMFVLYPYAESYATPKRLNIAQILFIIQVLFEMVGRSAPMFVKTEMSDDALWWNAIMRIPIAILFVIHLHSPFVKNDIVLFLIIGIMAIHSGWLVTVCFRRGVDSSSDAEKTRASIGIQLDFWLSMLLGVSIDLVLIIGFHYPK
jgi:hypothetical protein